MCGISGIIHFNGHDRDTVRGRIEAMTDALYHRGPDAGGYYIDDHAALGHRRLSIIDLSTGSQPMGSQDGRFQIVYNGEVYNFKTVRAELRDKGYVFATASDTEVLLNAYREWGQACVNRFNGMFAFAIWDRQDKQLFIARDRVGKKPLYYQWDGTEFAFSSELKSFLKAGLSRKQINPRALDCYFSFGYIPSPFSIYSDIVKLPPAHTLSVTADGLETARYWQLDFTEDRSLSLGEAMERFVPLFRDAVNLRLISDVPLGSFLSGGIDSSLVVSFMAELMDTPVKTNTIGFKDSEFNEIPAAGEISGFLKTDHRQYVVRPDAVDDILRVAACFDEPFADSSALPTWYVCQMARQNVTVALSGDGGDESFGGYTFRYTPHYLESRLRSCFPQAVRTLLFSGIGHHYPSAATLPRWLRLKTIFENLAVSDADAFYRDLIWLRGDTRSRLYSRAFSDELGGFSPESMVVPLYEGSTARNPVARCQDTDIRFYMTEDVLVKVDRMSMAHALEVRSPLLDYRIMEFAAALPLRLKLTPKQGKILLRRLVSKRFDSSLDRLPKKGFSIPAAAWLRHDLKTLAWETIFNSRIIRDCLAREPLIALWGQHQSGAADHSVFLWGLMMMGLWEKNYHDRGPVDTGCL